MVYWIDEERVYEGEFVIGPPLLDSGTYRPGVGITTLAPRSGASFQRMACTYEPDMLLRYGVRGIVKSPVV